jgi:hypothetical protein
MNLSEISYYENGVSDGCAHTTLISGEKVIDEFIKLHPAIEDKMASGEGVRGHFIDSQIAENILLKGIEYGICILPIHDGYISSASTIHILKGCMLDAFHEVTGQSAKVKAETFNLSIIDDAGQHAPYWITNSDNTTEMNGPLEGKAITYSAALNKQAIEKHLIEDAVYKTKRDTIVSEWKVAHPT